MSRLLICLLILLLCGCEKVYECEIFSDSDCLSYVDYFKFKAYTEEDAEGHCMKYEYSIDTYYKDGTAIDTSDTVHPQCCECSNPEPAIFGSDYVY